MEQKPGTQRIGILYIYIYKSIVSGISISQAKMPDVLGILSPRKASEGKPSTLKDILLIPSAFSMPTGEAHWELLMRTRAVECQCYVIAAAQARSRDTLGSCSGR